MTGWPKCDNCGRFMTCTPGASYAMRYSGYPPCPSHEVFRCRACTEKIGPLAAQSGMQPWTAGVYEPVKNPDQQHQRI